MDRPGGVECAHIATFMYTQHTHCYVHSVVLTNTCTYTHNDTHSHCKTMQDRLGQDVSQLAQFEHYIREGRGEEWEGRGGNGGRVKTGRSNQLFECSTHKGALSALPLHLVTLYLSIVCDDSGQVLCEEEEVRMR